MIKGIFRKVIDTKKRYFGGFKKGNGYPGWFLYSGKKQILNLKIFVKPGSRLYKIENRDDIFEDEPLMVSVKGKARDNEANEDLVEFLSDQLLIDENDFEIVKGDKSREKLLRITLNGYFSKKSEFNFIQNLYKKLSK